MSNMIFDDIDLELSVRPCGFIQKDTYGYYLDAYLRKSDVLKVMCSDIVPSHTDDDKFIVRVRLNNNTMFKINDIRIYNFDDKRLQSLPIQKLSLEKLIAKTYSKKARNALAGYCYATKIFFKIELPKTKGSMNA